MTDVSFRENKCGVLEAPVCSMFRPASVNLQTGNLNRNFLWNAWTEPIWG